MEQEKDTRAFYAWVPTIALAGVIALMLPGIKWVLLAYALVAATWVVGRVFTESSHSTGARAQVGLAVVHCVYESVIWSIVLPTIYAGDFRLNPLTEEPFVGLILLMLATALSGLVVGVYTVHAVIKQMQAAQREYEALQKQG